MKHQDTISRMALKDKIALCSGKTAWTTKAMPQYEIPGFFMCDGPHGLRKQEGNADMLGINQSRPATCFPTAALTACSWDLKLLEEMGAAIGEEAASLGVGLVLGPGANLKRDPRCGRNFEYFSEDPLLAGLLAAAEIQGLQKNGVGASLKHFACNSQEYKRFSSDSILDDRTLRELYLTPFELAVKVAQPAAVMCAYNKVNGTYCSDHKQLLTDILREEWGFEGLVVTDWGALHDRMDAFRAGCDLAMPGGSAHMERDALNAVKNGTLSVDAIDRSVDRVLELVNRPVEATDGYDAEAHHQLARKIARESAVLLQNTDSLLPLSEEQSVVLIGSMAKTPRFQGSGSSHINPTRLVSACEAMAQLPHVMGCAEDGSTTGELLAEAVAAANAVDVAVVFAGLTELYESEGYDRTHLHMPEGHLELIDAVSAANPNTVVVLLGGSVMECPWADRVKSILYLGLPGQAGGEAAADLLYGRANPCGKLAETWPMVLRDCPTAELYGTKDALYQEGIYVGYRYYDKAKKEVRWPFGHGLSYTTFTYAEPQIIGDVITVSVTNTGARAGAEIVQLYVTPPEGGLHRPVQELKGFVKIFLEPGQTKVVGFQMEDRSFALWKDGWVVPGGIYTARISGGSRSSGLTLEIPRQGETVEAPQWQAGSWYEQPDGTPSRSDWEAMLGRTYTEPILEKGRFTKENTVLEMKEHSKLMGLVYKGLEWHISRQFGGKADYSDPTFRMMIASSADATMRNLQINSGFKGRLFESVTEFANGNYRSGFKLLLRK